MDNRRSMIADGSQYGCSIRDNPIPTENAPDAPDTLAESDRRIATEGRPHGDDQAGPRTFTSAHKDAQCRIHDDE